MLETLPVSMQRCCLLQASSLVSRGLLGTIQPNHFRCTGCGMDWEADADGAWKGVRRQSVIPIRPSKLFSLIESEGPERVAQVRIPKRRDPNTPDYSLKLLETFVLVALMKLTKAERVFEFGTFLGNTATNLALNGGPDVRIFTLDLLPHTEVAAPRKQDHEAIDFRMNHMEMEWSTFPGLRHRIVPVYGDSTKLDFGCYHNYMDLVWLDGGRDAATVASDAHNAFCMLRQDKLAVIGWHDYTHPETHELKTFLDERASMVKLYHVEDTSMVLYFNRPVKLEA